VHDTLRPTVRAARAGERRAARAQVGIAMHAAGRLGAKLEAARGSGQHVDMEEEFRLLTLQVIGEAVLSLPPEECDRVRVGPACIGTRYSLQLPSCACSQSVWPRARITGRSHGPGVRDPACRA
jgi:cytochrome P450